MYPILVDNLKISNPNLSSKPKVHDKYMNQSVQEEDSAMLEEILRKNEKLEQQLEMAKE